RSLIGLLTGDSASPCLWNIFFADFQLPDHPDDVRLHGRAVSHVEQADDNIIMSTSFTAFQMKVSGSFFEWCGKKRVFISARKSKWMIFGPLPSIPPVLRLGDLIVELVNEFKYVGIWLTSTTPNIFSKNYSVKASKARNASNAAFAMKHRTGSLPVKEGLLLYMVRVDCYLISGADIFLVVDAALIHEHLEAQHSYLRRLLGIKSRSMLAVLFTETGLMPIQIRRLLLALGRLRYMAGLKGNRVVQCALWDSVDLFSTGFAGWAGDVAIMLSTLPTPIHIAPADFLSVPTIEALRKKVAEVVDTDFQLDIDHLKKTHLLRNRLESVEDKLSLVTRRGRHYLTMVSIPSHHKALTRLLLSDHMFSVERLRYPASYRLCIPQEECLCHFCCRAVEDEVHALLDCNRHGPLAELRPASWLTLLIVMMCWMEYLCCCPDTTFCITWWPPGKWSHGWQSTSMRFFILFDKFQRFIPAGYNIP
ncbi:hypothetical protein C8R44DRAFT_602888, partial [Mycena epipterygia]